MPKKERNQEFDIMKGIAIILMVWGHSIKYGRAFISSFNMPVFFMLSGVFFKECNSFSDVVSFSWKKIKSLYIYYITANLLFLLFHNLFININIYTDNKALLSYFPNAELYTMYSIKDFFKRILLILFTVGGTQLGGATWFFRALLFSSILYALLDYIFSKLKITNKNLCHLIIGLFFLVIAYFLSNRTVYISGRNVLVLVNQVIIPYVFFPLGKICYKNLKYLIQNRVVFIISFVLVLIILLLPLPYRLDISSGKIKNFFLLITSIAGFFLLYDISFVINKGLKVLPKLLLYLGQNTVYIVMYHLLAFKIVNILYVVINKLPNYCLAGFPTLMSICDEKGQYFLFGCLYMIVGVVVPLVFGLVDKQVDKFKTRIKERIEK